jgi:hypothetical protein
MVYSSRMAAKPLTRVTKHKKPLHQLYQPGFNRANGCYLSGDWITVSAAEWETRKAAHEKLYAKLNAAMKKQHHRDAERGIASLTPAERQAWEHYSGYADYYTQGPGGVGSIGIRTQMDLPHPKEIEGLRKKGLKVLKQILHEGEVIDQSAGFPPDLIQEGEPVDPWVGIVKQNKTRDEQMFFDTLGHNQPDAPEGSMGAFLIGVGIQPLLHVEEEIVRGEIALAKGKPDRFTDLGIERARYIRMRAFLEEKGFHEAYEHAKATHNECARHNLDSSDGRIFSFVLPVFHVDGTHEPCGPRDAPWNPGFFEDEESQTS